MAMPSKGETVLLALLGRLRAAVATPALTVERNTAVAQAVPADGLVIVRDGDPGEPEEILGNAGPYYYSHAVEIELYAQAGDPARRDALFDALRMAVAGALDADPTLGGAVHGMDYAAPQAGVEPIEGGEALKTGTITVTLDYESATRI